MADLKNTGKKPKGSGRRTDENPKDTVGIKFATPADAAVAKVKKECKPCKKKFLLESNVRIINQKLLQYLKKGKRAIMVLDRIYLQLFC